MARWLVCAPAILLLLMAAVDAARAQSAGAGTAVTLNGVDQYISIPRMFTNPPITIDFWFRTTVVETNAMTLMDMRDASGESGFTAEMINGQILIALERKDVGNGSLSPGVMGVQGFAADGYWHHLRVSYRVQTEATPVDVQIFASLDYGPYVAPPGLAPWDFGALPPTITLGAMQGGSNFFNGSFDEIEIWNRFPGANGTPPQLYVPNLHPLVGNESGLIGLYRLDDGSGLVAANSAVNGASSPAVLSGSPVWVQSEVPITPIPSTSSPAPAAEALMSQTFGGGDTQQATTVNGWNAIYLLVTPTNRSPGAIFTGLPVESIWAPKIPVSTATYIKNPNELPWNRAGWSVYIPPSYPSNRVESFNNDLFSMRANTAYLVKYSANALFPGLTVTGRPSLRRQKMAANGYTLRGYPLDWSYLSPSPMVYFQPSPANLDPNSGQLQPLYNLIQNNVSVWQQLGPDDSLNAMTAYWVYSNGGSDYQAPLDVSVDLGDGLDFGPTLGELKLNLKNLSSGPITVKMRNFASPAGVLVSDYAPPPDDSAASAPPLSYHQLISGNSGPAWVNFPAVLTLAMPANSKMALPIALRRGAMANDFYASVIEVTDGLGTRYFVPVTGTRIRSSN